MKILSELKLGGSEQAIRGLQQTMEEKGIKNALTVMEKLNDPHVTDDFHRYLVRYIAAGLARQGLMKKLRDFKHLDDAL